MSKRIVGRPIRNDGGLSPCPPQVSTLTALAAANPRPPVFVLNSLDADISVVDPASFTVTKRIPTGKEPHHLYLSPDEKSLIVANALGDSLTFVDPRTAEVQQREPACRVDLTEREVERHLGAIGAGREINEARTERQRRVERAREQVGK